jgi:hypothetical protein
MDGVKIPQYEVMHRGVHNFGDVRMKRVLCWIRGIGSERSMDKPRAG